MVLDFSRHLAQWFAILLNVITFYINLVKFWRHQRMTDWAFGL